MPTPNLREERAAALLERAYRMALVLQARMLQAPACRAAAGAGAGAGAVHGPTEPTPDLGFEPMAVCMELVELLDEARRALLGPPA